VGEVVDQIRQLLMLAQAKVPMLLPYWRSSPIGSAQKIFMPCILKASLTTAKNTEDMAEWAGHYKLRQKRQAALELLHRFRNVSSLAVRSRQAVIQAAYEEEMPALQ
jgi:hypothetical protein